MNLFQHQEYVLEKSKDERSFAWFLETGTGKTIIAIENIAWLWETNKINFAIIIAPKMVCEAVWESELKKWLSIKYRLFKWIGDISDIDKNIINYIITDIAKAEKQINNIIPILLINIEAFSHKRVFHFIIEILKVSTNILILDESTSIKNPKALRTKGLLSISRLCNYRRILSGYPILRSPEDLYSQIKFLGQNLIPYASFYAFRNQFCVMRSMGRYQIVISHKNLNLLAEQIQKFSIRITKKDCLDLPEKIRTKRYIEMTKEQNDLYQQMKKQCYLELKETSQTIFATSFLAQLSKLHQIANGILIQQNQIISLKKYEVLVEIIENEIPNQCVIWCWYTETLKLCEYYIEENFGNGSWKSIYGEVSHSDRIQALNDFQNKRVKFLLANPATAMHGLNLTNCSYVIYFNNSTNLEHRIQSEDRFHRIGQVNKVTYIDLITKGTVEEKILTKLQQNHKIGADVLKDEWEEWFQ